MPSTTPPLRKVSQQGFTLIELLVTVAIVGVLASLAFPDFSEMLRNWRRDSATRAFVTHIQMARTEALKASRRVVVCSSTNGSSCTGGSEWSTGWLVFVDNNANGAFDTGERQVAQGQAMAGLESMASTGNVSAMVFQSNGLMGAGATTITVKAKGSTSSSRSNLITVDQVGRTRVSHD